MGVYSFQTIREPSEGYYKESGSKFLAFAYPVSSEDEIKVKISHLKKEYFDATHHCFAWILDPDKGRSRAFDDGEPNHSAGDPIIGQLRSKNLTNILVVVVRYFGGTKLGVGGLIHAYKLAAESALLKAIVIEKNVQLVYALKFPYHETPEIMKLLKDYEAKPSEQRYGDSCEMKVSINLKSQNDFESRLRLMVLLGQQISFHEVL